MAITLFEFAKPSPSSMIVRCACFFEFVPPGHQELMKVPVGHLCEPINGEYRHACKDCGRTVVIEDSK